MTKSYKFECTDIDAETGSTTTIKMRHTTNCDTWSGYDGPMHKFFLFLQANGFVFNANDQIGIMTEYGNFKPASDDPNAVAYPCMGGDSGDCFDECDESCDPF